MKGPLKLFAYAAMTVTMSMALPPQTFHEGGGGVAPGFQVHSFLLPPVASLGCGWTGLGQIFGQGCTLVTSPGIQGAIMKRNANAIWTGDLKQGQGKFSVGSGAIKDQAFTFRTRFEADPGTNPEELIAAAHAGCFSMALSAQLGERGITPVSVTTSCAVTFENLTLTKSALTTTVKAPGADKAKIEEAAAAAKAGCPISKVLKLEISLDLTVST
jgi:lipoyl-dependent peroxiredoxin